MGDTEQLLGYGDVLPYWHSKEEEDDFTSFSRLAQKWGWAWAVFTRGDIDGRIDRATTDEEWEAIRFDHYWTSIGDVMDEYGAESVFDVIQHFNLDRASEDDAHYIEGLSDER